MPYDHGTRDIQHQPPQLSRLSGPVGRQVRRKRRDLVAVAAAHDVTKLRVFGSVARGEDRPGSDVDLLVDLPPDMGLLGLGRVQEDLEAILGTKVDLVPWQVALGPVLQSRDVVAGLSPGRGRGPCCPRRAHWPHRSHGAVPRNHGKVTLPWS